MVRRKIRQIDSILSEFGFHLNTIYAQILLQRKCSLANFVLRSHSPYHLWLSLSLSLAVSHARTSCVCVCVYPLYCSAQKYRNACAIAEYNNSTSIPYVRASLYASKQNVQFVWFLVACYSLIRLHVHWNTRLSCLSRCFVLSNKYTKFARHSN